MKKYLISILIVCAVVLALPTLAAAQGLLNLPSSQIGIQTGPWLGGTMGSTLDITLYSVPSGFSVTNATYVGWCAEDDFQPDNTNFLTNVYDSTGPVSNLPRTYQFVPWPKVNYLLNHKIGNTDEVQSALWIVMGTNNPTSPFFPADTYSNDANVASMVNAANSNPTFLPSGGQVVAVPIFTDGYLAHGACQDAFQDTIIEVPLPGPTAPAMTLTKSASPTTATAGHPVTYTYTVTNTGGLTINNITITDDNGTPGYTADDFVVASGITLNPGQSQSFSATIYPPIKECATVNNVPNTFAGTLIVQVDPGEVYNGITVPAGSIKAIFRQSQSLNDNRYGTGATSATGWPSGHKFSDLTGSDMAHIQFYNAAGTNVLEADFDYISQAKSWTFGGGTVNYPSGYGALGATGGDGKMILGSSSNILVAGSTLSDNLLLSQFVTGFLVNSPPETSPNSNISNPAGWDYTDGYTVIVKSSTFGTSGFGHVNVAGLHDSPPKTGTTNLITPTPCPNTVTNTANATGTTANGNVSSGASASVSVTQ
ncbi:MAG: hypothetical protein PHX83_16885 [Acidobacteriia bacterium]|nr:hypothetical protein [Terriglobia bacterium]